MEYVESLERAHRKDARATNIYVEHPHRPCPPVGNNLHPSPDPITSRKANCCSSGDNRRVFTTALAIRQLPADDALKALVRSPSAHSATDFRCARPINYQKPSQDRETLRHGLLQPTERLLSPPDCSPSVHHHHTCCPAPHESELHHHKPTLVTGFLQPSVDSLPSRTYGRPVGCRTPSPDRQRQEVLDAAGGGVMRVKYGHSRTIVSEEEEEVCPRCGKPKRVETDEQGMEGSAGYGTSRVIDAVSCLCCVKAVFYHCCSEEDDDTHLSDAPCSCTGRPLCCPRWTCLVLAGITCLPCLALYWPCRILLRLIARCRGVCTGSGCACAKDKEGYDACAFRKF